MELDWSEHSPHIRTLFHPWKSDDGYNEVMITAAETRLGVPLPTPLRTFYKAWGQRHEMSSLHDYLLAPDRLIVQNDGLIFCYERDGACCWGVQRECLNESNPPIVKGHEDVDTSNSPVDYEDIGDLHLPIYEKAIWLWKPSHGRLSDFLDDFTYRHAFNGGAMHGGWMEVLPHQGSLQEFQKVWLSHHWYRISVDPWVFYAERSESFPEVPLYVRDGQALALVFGLLWAVTCSTEALDEISQAMQATWKHRW